ncbi:MAG: haloacid dehalogenase-like hydrolase [Actinobacteria bacterium]|nr:haloacid dehalogenase-like hydrolase [Actinomycetota bacterium]
MPAPVLVLWDVDHTLVHAGPAGPVLYESVLADLYGLDLPGQLMSMAGRTDTSIALEVLTAAGLDAARELPRFHAFMAAQAPALADMIREQGTVLPGVREALAAVASHSADGLVVQSLLTGNIRALAKVKLQALEILDQFDFDAGAYGDVSPIRADLVHAARKNATARYGTDFSGHATVLVGDTPLDVEAAAAADARAVGVATGRFSIAQLADAGADVVLPDLTDTLRVTAALLADRDG